MVIDEQVAIVADDLTQLYEDQFIETCAPWVIPYIGDLIGYQSVQGIAPAIDNPRAEVAQTISLRRRKGTVLVLEQLARDATGWGAHAVEFFQVLGDTEYMNHVRPATTTRRTCAGGNPACTWTAPSTGRRTGSTSGRISSGRGRYNIQNIGVFLWSLGAYGITDAPVTAAATNTAGGAQCYRFSPLGMDMPLFHRAVPQGEQISAAARPVNVAARLRRRVLCADLQGRRRRRVLRAGRQPAAHPGRHRGQPVSDQGRQPFRARRGLGEPPRGRHYAVVVDPELGRIALPPLSAGATAPQLNATLLLRVQRRHGGR